MSYLGPIDNLDAFPWTYEVDFTAGDAGEQYERAGFKCVRTTPAEYVDSNRMVRVARPHEPVFEFDAATGRSLGLRCEKAHNNYLHNSEDLTKWASWYGGLPGLAKGFPDPAGGRDAWSFRVADIPPWPGDPIGRLGGIINTGLVTPVEHGLHSVDVWIRCDTVRNFRLGFSDAMTDYQATPTWKRFSFVADWTAAKDKGRLCQLLFGFQPSELHTGAVSPDTRFYIWHPWMWRSSVDMSYIKAESAPPYADHDYHYADIHPMFAGYNPEGAFYIEWERKGQTVNNDHANGLFQMSTIGAAPDVYSYFAQEYPITNSMGVIQFWNRDASAVEGPLRNWGAPGGKGIQRAAFAWYKSGHEPPGAAINGQPYRRMTGNTAVSAGPVGFTRLLLGCRTWAEPLDGYIRKLKFSTRFNPHVAKDALPVTPTAPLLTELTSDQLNSSGDFA